MDIQMMGCLIGIWDQQLTKGLISNNHNIKILRGILNE